MNAAIFVPSLTPFADSTPLDTSTPQGRTRRIARATLSAEASRENHRTLAGGRQERPVEALADTAVFGNIAVVEPGGGAREGAQVF
jgi:hypothetical protein